jgi:hypothetical protein
MLPHNTETMEVAGLFEGEFPSLSHHCGQMSVKAEMGFNDRPGVNGSQLDDELYAGHSVEKKSKQDHDKNIAFRHILGNREKRVSKV